MFFPPSDTHENFCFAKFLPNQQVQPKYGHNGARGLIKTMPHIADSKTGCEPAGCSPVLLLEF